MPSMTPTENLLSLADTLKSDSRALHDLACALAKYPTKPAEWRRASAWSSIICALLVPGTLSCAGLVIPRTSNTCLGWLLITSIVLLATYAALFYEARYRQLRPVRYSRAACRAGLKAVTVSEWATTWRDAVNAQGRPLLVADALICQALARAQTKTLAPKTTEDLFREFTGNA